MTSPFDLVSSNPFLLFKYKYVEIPIKRYKIGQTIIKTFLDGEKGFKEKMTWTEIEQFLEPILNDEKINKDKKLTDFWIREL